MDISYLQNINPLAGRSRIYRHRGKLLKVGLGVFTTGTIYAIVRGVVRGDGGHAHEALGPVRQARGCDAYERELRTWACRPPSFAAYAGPHENRPPVAWDLADRFGNDALLLAPMSTLAGWLV